MFWADTLAGTLNSAITPTAVTAHDHNPRVTQSSFLMRSSRCCSKGRHDRRPSWEQVKPHHASHLQFPRTSVVEETGVDSIDAAARSGGRIRSHAVHAVEHIHATSAAAHGRSIVGGAELLTRPCPRPAVEKVDVSRNGIGA